MPIILGWIALIALLNVIVPQLEAVGKMRSVSMSPDDAPSVIAIKRVGEVFQEYNSNSSVMIVLEGEQPLGADAHAYYDQMVEKLEADTKHVEHVQDFWSDPLTARGRAEQRRQGRLRPGLPGRQPGRGAGQRVRRGGAEHRRRRAAAAGRQGLRHRARRACRRPAHRRRSQHASDRGRHVHRHHHRCCCWSTARS